MEKTDRHVNYYPPKPGKLDSQTVLLKDASDSCLAVGSSSYGLAHGHTFKKKIIAGGIGLAEFI